MTPNELKTWRKVNGYSQNQLAGALGVTNICVSRWERGVRKIPSFLHLALDALECKGGEPLGRVQQKKGKERR